MYCVFSKWLHGNINCYRDFKINKSVLVGGATDTSGTKHNVVASFIHPKFNNVTLDNDIAVAKLNCASRAMKVRLNFNKNVPSTDMDALNAGFGMREDNMYPEDLYEATVQVVSIAVCKKNCPKIYRWGSS
jgi:Trypsin